MSPISSALWIFSSANFQNKENWRDFFKGLALKSTTKGSKKQTSKRAQKVWLCVAIFHKFEHSWKKMIFLLSVLVLDFFHVVNRGANHIWGGKSVSTQTKEFRLVKKVTDFVRTKVCDRIYYSDHYNGHTWLLKKPNINFLTEFFLITAQNSFQ